VLFLKIILFICHFLTLHSSV